MIPHEPKPSLLIADDDAVVRSALSLALREGFEIVGDAHNAEDAIRQAGALRPDIVILDVEMPDGGGIRAAREIRSCAPETTIVALSGDENDATVRAMIQAGAMAYVRKGMGRGELDRILRQSIAAHAR